MILLGIFERCTPSLAADIAQAVAALCSIQEATHMLSERGIVLDAKKVDTIAKRVSDRARAAIKGSQYELGETLDGRRVIISTDGGRLRIRKNKKGKKTKKGRSRYHTDWKEPKLIIIYVVNKEGKQERQFAPLIDGTMAGADGIFALLQLYLSKLNLSAADQVLFVADGAQWIWNRVPKLVAALKLMAVKFFQLVDYYHAVEHLNAVAKFKKSWSAKERKRWVKKQKGHLLNGEIDDIIASIDKLRRGRMSKEFRRERNYFNRNRCRMNFKAIVEMNLPIGSGAMESAIRRVVNLRIKGCGIFWKKESAEQIIFLRSYYKAGRWETLKRLAFTAVLSNPV